MALSLMGGIFITSMESRTTTVSKICKPCQQKTTLDTLQCNQRRFENLNWKLRHYEDGWMLGSERDAVLLASRVSIGGNGVEDGGELARRLRKQEGLFRGGLEYNAHRSIHTRILPYIVMFCSGMQRGTAFPSRLKAGVPCGDFYGTDTDAAGWTCRR